jgi:TPR repeat protein
VEQSHSRSFELFLDAGERGHNLAWKELAHMYAEGIGVEPDENEADKWGTKYREWKEYDELYPF